MKNRVHKKISRLIRGYFRGKLLSNFGKGILADTKNGLFIVDPKDFSLTKKLLKYGSYDYEEIVALKNILSDKSTVIFVGCHIGTLLIPIAQTVNTVYGFEANPKNFELLQYNLLLNKISNAKIENIAIGEEEKKVTIKHNISNTGNSSVNLNINSNSDLIQMKKLDSVIQDKKIDIIIMDIEGYEINAIKGATITLSNTKYFYVEFAPEQLQDFGMNRNDFVNSLKELYENMYIFQGSENFLKFENQTWINYLINLPEKRGLLLNLLFTNSKL